jgi:hypothetical protein
VNENDFVTDFIDVHSMRDENRGPGRLVLAKDPQEQMFGVDPVMKESIGFLSRQLQNPIGLGTEAVLVWRRLLLPRSQTVDVLADRFWCDTRARKKATDRPAALAYQRKQKVLALDGYTATVFGFVARKK